MPKPVATARIQLAAPSVVPSWAPVAAAAMTGLIVIYWVSRHLLALHRFLLKSEVYVIRHPLTDIGLLIIAGLLFILSQTAGLVQ